MSAKSLTVRSAAVALRDAMRHVAGSISVITAGTGAERTGLTASSVVSLSLDPPTMIVSINRTASAWPVIRRHGHFCINLLAPIIATLLKNSPAGTVNEACSDMPMQNLMTLATVQRFCRCGRHDRLRAGRGHRAHSHAIVLGAVKAVQVNGGAGWPTAMAVSERSSLTRSRIVERISAWPRASVRYRSTAAGISNPTRIGLLAPMPEAIEIAHESRRSLPSALRERRQTDTASGRT